MRLLIAAVVWLGAVAGGVGVSRVVADSIHNQPAGASDPSAVTARDPSSMFRTRNFAEALTRARSDLGANAEIDNFVIYPGYLSMTAVENGAEVDWSTYTDGSVQKTVTGATPDASSIFRLNRIRPSDPVAIANLIAATGSTSASQLHYMVIERDPISRRLQWLIYPVAGTAVEYFETSGPRGRLFEYRTNSSTGLQPAS